MAGKKLSDEDAARLDAVYRPRPHIRFYEGGPSNLMWDSDKSHPLWDDGEMRRQARMAIADYEDIRAAEPDSNRSKEWLDAAHRMLDGLADGAQGGGVMLRGDQCGTLLTLRAFALSAQAQRRAPLGYPDGWWLSYDGMLNAWTDSLTRADGWAALYAGLGGRPVLRVWIGTDPLPEGFRLYRPFSDDEQAQWTEYVKDRRQARAEDEEAMRSEWE